MGRIKQPTFKFQPFSRKQRQILTWWLPESGVSERDGIIADGAIRSGKTVSMSLAFIMWAMESFRDENFAMCGKTIGSFRRNVLVPLKRMLASRGYQLNDHRADNMVEVKRGKRTNFFYIFGGRDERSQDLIQGITLAGLLMDEVALMPESFVNQATGRCSVTGSKFWFNCNPANPAHWFKTGWIDKRDDKNLLYLHFSMDDNLSLSESTKARYRSMYAGVFFRRYILGEWCVAEGVVYPMFDPERHVTANHETRGFASYYVSIDYGTMNPTAMGLWQVADGKATMLREYYHDGRKTGRQKTDEEYYTDLEAFAAGYNIERVIVDPSAASFKETIRRHGKYNVWDAQNAVMDGIRYTAMLLQAGKLLFDASCKNTFNEFAAYCWDESRPGGEDAVIKQNDHSMDQMRYLVMTVMRRDLRRGV